MGEIVFILKVSLRVFLKSSLDSLTGFMKFIINALAITFHMN